MYRKKNYRLNDVWLKRTSKIRTFAKTIWKSSCSLFIHHVTLLLTTFLLLSQFCCCCCFFFCLFTCFFNMRIRKQWCENLKAKCHYIFDVVGKCSKEPSNWKITQSSFWNLTLDNTLVIKRELYWFEWMVDNLNKWINQWVASINEWSVMRNYGLTWIITWWYLNKLSEYSELSVT